MAYFHIYMDHVSNLIGLQIDFQFIINRYIANPKIKRKYIQQYFPAHCHIKSVHDSPSQVSRSCHDINITNIFNTHPNIFAGSDEVLLPRPPQPDCVGLGRWQRCRPVPARPAARRGRGGRSHGRFLRHTEDFSDISHSVSPFCHHMGWNNTYVHQISKIDCPQWLGADPVLQRPSLATIEPQNRFVIADCRGRVGGVSPLSVRSKTPHHRTGPDTRHWTADWPLCFLQFFIVRHKSQNVLVYCHGERAMMHSGYYWIEHGMYWEISLLFSILLILSFEKFTVIIQLSHISQHWHWAMNGSWENYKKRWKVWRLSPVCGPESWEGSQL